MRKQAEASAAAEGARRATGAGASRRGRFRLGARRCSACCAGRIRSGPTRLRPGGSLETMHNGQGVKITPG